MEHTSHAFEQELGDLTQKVSSMGTVARQLLDEAVAALLAGDKVLAARVIESDRELDLAQREIESLAVQMIARRQPMADDLRAIVAAMRMVADLERVGDLGKNIAKRTVAIQSSLERRVVSSGVESLAQAAKEQVEAVMKAFEHRDADAARAVRLGDERIDVLYTALFRELLTYMMEDPRSITLCAHLLFCAKNLERVGDHATNLAETVEYAITGDSPPVDRPKGVTVPVEG